MRILEILIGFLNLYRIALKRKKHVFSFVGFYYCERVKNICLLLSFFRKDKIFSIPIQDLAKSKFFLKKLSPVDSFYAGFLFRMEKVGSTSLQERCKLKNAISVKNDNNLKVPTTITLHSICYSKNNIILKLISSGNTFIVSPQEILKNQFILSSIDSTQTFQIGYSFSDLLPNLQ